MNHLVATARNLLIGTHEKNHGRVTPESELTTEPIIEMILTTYHKQMEFIDNNLINVKKTQSHRITLNINSAQALATELQEWVKETQALKTKLQETKLTCES